MCQKSNCNKGMQNTKMKINEHSPIKRYCLNLLSFIPSKEGKKNILVICPGFSSDCVETLEEISIQGKESFMKSGGENFEMIPCLNDGDDHIALIKHLVLENI